MAQGRWNMGVGRLAGWNYSKSVNEKSFIYGKEMMNRIRHQIHDCHKSNKKDENITEDEDNYQDICYNQTECDCDSDAECGCDCSDEENIVCESDNSNQIPFVSLLSLILVSFTITILIIISYIIIRCIVVADKEQRFEML